MSNDAYSHALLSDQRHRSAMNTASKVGGAYIGWVPKPRPTLRGHLYAIAVGLLAAGLLTLIERIV